MKTSIGNMGQLTAVLGPQCYTGYYTLLYMGGVYSILCALVISKKGCLFHICLRESSCSSASSLLLNMYSHTCNCSQRGISF